jgi:hypothetical protein
MPSLNLAQAGEPDGGLAWWLKPLHEVPLDAGPKSGCSARGHAPFHAVQMKGWCGRWERAAAATVRRGAAAKSVEELDSHWRGRIYGLLIQVQVNTNRLKVLNGAQEVDQRSSEPVDRPCHHNIELPAARIFKQKIKAGPIGAPLRATDAGVIVDPHHLPASPLSDLTKFA